jgi:hypothetical protein
MSIISSLLAAAFLTGACASASAALLTGTDKSFAVQYDDS